MKTAKVYSKGKDKRSEVKIPDETSDIPSFLRLLKTYLAHLLKANCIFKNFTAKKKNRINVIVDKNLAIEY